MLNVQKGLNTCCQCSLIKFTTVIFVFYSTYTILSAQIYTMAVFPKCAMQHKYSSTTFKKQPLN